MKTIRHYLLATAMMMLALPVLSACGDDDENTPAQITVNEQNAFTGTTTTWPESNPESKYTSTKSIYTVVFDQENNLAKLIITDADFLEGMPALQPMTFPDIKYTVNESAIILNNPSLIPSIAGRPYSGFPITNLQAKLVTDKSLDLQFVCNYRGTPYVVYFRGVPTEQPE